MQREEMDILEQQARLWAFNKHFAMRDVEIAKAAFLAGHASRDEEVRVLVETLKRTTQRFNSCLDLNEIDEIVIRKANEILSKYSPQNTISETEEEPTDLNP